MGKTAGSRKKVTKSIVAENPDIQTEGALEEAKGLLNRSPEDAPPSKRVKKTSSKASSKASSKKIVIVVEEAEEDKVEGVEKEEDKVVVVQDDAPTKSAPTISESEPLAEVRDVEMTTEDSKQEQEVADVVAPLSPKSTLLAFRRDPALQTQSMQDKEPVTAAQKVATPAATVSVVEPLPATKVASVAAHTDVPESLPHPIARDTIDYYKQSMAAMSKENESLKSLLGQVQGCLKQSEDGFVQYKQLHELKVSELTKSVEMLTAERTSFTIALQAEESQDGETGGVSLAHYRSLVAQMEAMKQQAIERESELHTTKQTLSLFQRQCSELNERLETLSLKTEEVKGERDGALGTVEQLTAQLAEQTTLVSEKTADANKFKEAFEKARTENSRLQTIAVQTQSQLAAIEAKKTSLEAQEKLASELKSEIIYTATLEKMLEVIKKLTGLSLQNVETITRQDMNSMETHEYTQFTIKQKGNTQSLSYLLCVPTDKKQNMIYVPSNKGGQNVPAWLADEMEFENHMIRLFFCNVLAFCNNEERGAGEDDLVGMMP